MLVFESRSTSHIIFIIYFHINACNNLTTSALLGIDFQRFTPSVEKYFYAPPFDMTARYLMTMSPPLHVSHIIISPNISASPLLLPFRIVCFLSNSKEYRYKLVSLSWIIESWKYTAWKWALSDHRIYADRDAYLCWSHLSALGLHPSTPFQCK